VLQRVEILSQTPSDLCAKCSAPRQLAECAVFQTLLIKVSDSVNKEVCPLKWEFAYFSDTVIIRYWHVYL